MACQAGCLSLDPAAEAGGSGEESPNVSTSIPIINSSNSTAPSPSLVLLVPQVPIGNDPEMSALGATTEEQADPEPVSSDFLDEEFSPWKWLPDLVLTNIFLFLNDVDRCSASLVCKTWRRAFTNPVLWRSRYFEFRGYETFARVASYQKYLTTFGRYMQNMYVELSRPNFNTTGIIAMSFNQFVNSVNKTPGIKLQHFTLVIADVSSSWHLYLQKRTMMVRALCSLLKKQAWLRSVDLSYCLMDRVEGTKVLNALSYNSHLRPKAYLSDINLQQFFTHRSQVVNFEGFGKVMGQFTSLVTLKIDLKFLSVSILHTLTQASCHTIRNLELDFSMHDTIEEEITTECWRSVAKRLPALRVKVRIRGLCVFQRYVSVLSRGLPLSELRVYYQGMEDLANPDIISAVPALLTYVAKTFNATLTKFSLQVRPDVDFSADSAAVELVGTCSILQVMYLNVVLQATTVLQMLEAIRRLRLRGEDSVYQFSEIKIRLRLNARGMTPQIDDAIKEMTWPVGGDSNAVSNASSVIRIPSPATDDAAATVLRGISIVRINSLH